MDKLRHIFRMVSYSAARVPLSLSKRRAALRNYFSRDWHFNRKNRRDAAKLELPAARVETGATSVSDVDDYRQIVEAAVQDNQVFELFRSHPNYYPILEHVSQAQGLSYLQVLRQRSNIPADWAITCRSVNDLGSPQKYSYPGLKRVSPTVLRYLKVYSDLELLFGPLQGLRCIEIGIGFGGQAAILDLLGKVGEFQLYDLPAVLELGKKFLEDSQIAAPAFFFDGTMVPVARPADLLVSNYAFSELTRKLQLVYLERVIAKAARGYITWNSLSPDGLQPEEILARIPRSRVIAEDPKTHPDNLVIVWGSD
ncbi:hypothetical protein N8716_00080 [Pontimonas sp.]|nr:hypothetical protein [Pontimonas sp.]